VGGVARFLPPLLQSLRHPVESIREGADLVLRLHDAAVLELSGGERLGILPELAQGAHDTPRQRPRDRRREQQRGECEQRAPGQTPEHGRECDIGRQADRYEPGDELRRR